MKEGWEYKKLGEVCNIVGRIGFRGYKRTDYVDSESEGAISLSPSNIVDGELVYEKNTYISWEKYEESPEIMIFEGDVLLVKTASVGKNAIVKELPHKATINPQFVVFKNITINNKYLLFAIRSKYMQTKIRMITSGSSVPTLSQKALGELAIPLPPLSEQQSIVAELDKINEIIDLKKEQLKDLDLLAQSIFYDMFGDPIENPKGWEVKKLGDVSKVKIGPFGSLLHKSDYVTGGTPLVNPIHMKDGHIVKDDNFTITDEKKNEMTAYLLKEGDVLFARRGEIGRSAIVTKLEDGYLCGTGSLFVRFQERLNNIFVLYWTNSKSFITELVSQAKGATMLNINCKIVEDLNIILPPLSLQQSFASKIQAIESQKSAIKQSLAEMETLLASRMDYYFN